MPQVINEIGGDIDFVILDTVHTLPGEVLDFIAVLPYLKNDAVLVLHDVSLNQRVQIYRNLHATTVLFGAVTAEKFLNYDEKNFFNYPNIAAFKVSEQTVEHIDNVFLTLIISWNYFPSVEQLNAYYGLYRKLYPFDLCQIFKEAADMNGYNFWLAGRK